MEKVEIGTPRKINSGLILLGLSLATLMTSIDTNIVSIGLPTITKSLNTNFSSAQWIILSYLLSITVLIVGVGRIGDMFGKRNLYLTGIAIFTFASLVCGFSSSVYMLITARILQGVGGAILMAMSFALVGDLFSKEKISQAMGFLTSMLTLGIALGPSLGGVLISMFGWHIIFLVNIPIGIGAFVIAFQFPKMKVTHAKQGFDWLGVMVLAVALICYNLGITFSEAQGASVTVVSLLTFAAISTVVLLLVEKKVSSPLIDLTIFQNKVISGSLAISMIVYAMIMTISIVLPFFLTDAQRLSTVEVGLLIAVGPLATTILGPIAGKAASRFGNQAVMIAGMIGFGIGCCLMTTLTKNSSPFDFALRIAISNGSFAFFQTPNNAAVITSAQPEQRGVISGLLNLARTLGQTTGASLMGAIYAYFTMAAQKAHSGEVHGSTSSITPAAIISGVHGTFLVVTVVVLIAIIIGIFTLSQKKESSTD